MGLFKPYNKRNNIPQYVNAKSNHPPPFPHPTPNKYRNLFQNKFCRILVMNKLSMLLHRFITTLF